MLDIRLLAGAAGLVADAAARVEAWARRDPRAFASAIGDDAARRADRFGSVAHLLEPDLKEGSGGWRDLHSIWLIESAVGTELLRAREREALAGAEEFLARARSALHLETGKPGDRLILDHQPAIARSMGFEDEPDLISIDGLMRALFEHARQVEFLLRAMIERVLGERRPLPDPPGSAAEMLDALATEAEEGREPSAALLDAIEEIDMPEEVVWDADTRKAFSRLLRTGRPRRRGARDRSTGSALLARFIPEWAGVRCRPQRDPYHRFTVDAHLTSTLRGDGSEPRGGGRRR